MISAAKHTVLLITVMAIASCSSAAHPTGAPTTSGASQPANDLADQVAQAYLRYNPTYATFVGYHGHDRQIERFDREATEEALDTFKALGAKIRLVRRPLPLDQAIDLELAQALIEQSIFGLETHPEHVLNPLTYVWSTVDSVSLLLAKDFAPLATRAESVAARLEQIPEALKVAKQNLRGCPKVWTEEAITSFADAKDLYVDKVQEVFAGLPAKERERLRKLGGRAAEAAASFAAHLKDVVLPQGTSEFALGKEAIAFCLRTQEFVTEPVSSVSAWAMRAAKEAQQQLQKQCGEIMPGRSPRDVIRELMADHPSKEKLQATVAAHTQRMVEFVKKGVFVSYPPDLTLEVQETPPHLRDKTLLTVSFPGPFEPNSFKSIEYFSPPNASWPEAAQDQYLFFFNTSLLPLVVAHEAVPGHLLQLSLSRKAASSVRKAFLSRGFAEGWAHYAESMILDQGYSSDPKLRLFATQSVLSRLARLILVIKLHTEGMTLDRAAAFYEQLAFVSPAQAKQETRRATYELGLMSYAIGRMQILKLLAEEKARRGSAFSLREFHDRLLSYGTLPVSVIGRLMLAPR